MDPSSPHLGNGDDTADAGTVCVPPLPDLEARIANFLRSKPRCEPPGPTKSPVDEMTWFKRTQAYVYQFEDVAIHQVLPVDSSRVAILFSGFEFQVFTASVLGGTITGSVTPDGAGGFNVNLSTAIDTTETSVTSIFLFPDCNIISTGTMSGGFDPGIELNPYSPNAFLTQSDYGAIIQSAWYAFSGDGDGEVLSVFEILLNDWPRCPHP